MMRRTLVAGLALLSLTACNRPNEAEVTALRTEITAVKEEVARLRAEVETARKSAPPVNEASATKTELAQLRAELQAVAKARTTSTEVQTGEFGIDIVNPSVVFYPKPFAGPPSLKMIGTKLPRYRITEQTEKGFKLEIVDTIIDTDKMKYEANGIAK